MTLPRLITAAALLILAACTSPDNTSTADTAASGTRSLSATPTLSASPRTLSSTTTTTPPELTPTAPPADVTVAVLVKDGKVTPNSDNVHVKVGQIVRISIGSDVGESIHVHGYDKTVEVKPGDTNQTTFVADQKGVFEVETHETEKLVAKLIVS